MDDERETLTFEEAVKRLPDGNYVHTYRQAGPILVGADHDRAALLEAMQKADAIDVTGPSAQAMHHGLAIFDDLGALFIETRRKDE